MALVEEPRRQRRQGQGPGRLRRGLRVGLRSHRVRGSCGWPDQAPELPGSRDAQTGEDSWSKGRPWNEAARAMTSRRNSTSERSLFMRLLSD